MCIQKQLNPTILLVSKLHDQKNLQLIRKKLSSKFQFKVTTKKKPIHKRQHQKPQSTSFFVNENESELTTTMNTLMIVKLLFVLHLCQRVRAQVVQAGTREYYVT